MKWVWCVSERRMQVLTGVFEEKKSTLKAVMVTGIVQLIAGILSMVSWGLMIAYVQGDAEGSVAYVSAGLWAGFYCLFPAVFAIVVGIEAVKLVVRINMFFWLLGLNIGLLVVSAQLLRYGITYLSNCSDPGAFCRFDQDLKVAMSAISVASGCVMILTGALVLVFHWMVVYRTGRRIDCRMNAQFNQGVHNPAATVPGQQQYPPPPVGAQPAPQYPQYGVNAPPQYGVPPANNTQGNPTLDPTKYPPVSAPPYSAVDPVGPPATNKTDTHNDTPPPPYQNNN